MRKSTPAISLAMAWKAPPRTRSVIGSTSMRVRVGEARLPADLVLHHAHAVTSISAASCRASADAPTSMTMFP